MLVPIINEACGWLLVGLGMTVGVWMGVGFRNDGWLGGYDAWPRRLVRLGHIAMIALGMLNVLFAHSAPRIAVPALWLDAAGWSLLAGAVAMPACCFLAAWRRATVTLFALPVVCLLFGVTVAWVGLLARAFGGAG